MAKQILDSSILIAWWCAQNPRPADEDHARQCGEQLAGVHRTRRIVSPVWLEAIAGSRSRDELRLFEAFLSAFEVADNWDVSQDDLATARQIVRRVPRDGRPRDLGDDLIKAIAIRLRHDVITADRRFSR